MTGIPPRLGVDDAFDDGEQIDDFDVAHNRVLHLRVLLEGGAVGQRLERAGDALDGLGNMPKVIFDALRVVHTASACCKILLRNFSGKALGVRGGYRHAEQLFGVVLERGQRQQAGGLDPDQRANRGRFRRRRCRSEPTRRCARAPYRGG